MVYQTPSKFSAKVSKLKMMLPSEKPPMGNARSIKITNIPIEPMERYAAASLGGKKSEKILDPSSGGIGSKLNIARRRLSLNIK